MWPWEHLAVSYLAYSGLVRVRSGRPPRDPLAVFVLAVAALFPDLVDKPLSWTFGVLPSGTSLGHSVVLAVPLIAVLLVLTKYVGRPAVGIAFAVGYLLHLPSDAIYGALVLGSPITPGIYAWPLVEATPHAPPGFAANLQHYFGRYVSVMTSSRGTIYIVAELVLIGGAGALWLVDGAPGLELLAPAREGEPDPHR